MPEFIGRPRESGLAALIAQLQARRMDPIAAGITQAGQSIGGGLGRMFENRTLEDTRALAAKENQEKLSAILLEKGLLGQGGQTGAVAGGQKVWDKGVPLTELFPRAGFAPESGLYAKTGAAQDKEYLSDSERNLSAKKLGVSPEELKDVRADIVKALMSSDATKEYRKESLDLKKAEIAEKKSAAELKKTEAEGQKTASLDSAYKLYETARDGLVSGLAGTMTGPLAGRLPAFTTGQQVAEGGVAAMAPVLKQLFRVSGEGVFTDRDQALLLDMVPKRTDRKEAAAKKINNIDKIVRAKLSISDKTQVKSTAGTMEKMAKGPGDKSAVPYISSDGGKTWQRK